eukprot:6851733-Prymnesium_polylepis.2
MWCLGDGIRDECWSNSIAEMSASTCSSRCATPCSTVLTVLPTCTTTRAHADLYSTAFVQELWCDDSSGRTLPSGGSVARVAAIGRVPKGAAFGSACTRCLVCVRCGSGCCDLCLHC